MLEPLGGIRRGLGLGVQSALFAQAQALAVLTYGHVCPQSGLLKEQWTARLADLERGYKDSISSDGTSLRDALGRQGDRLKRK